jgi:hypothetical protein
MKGIDFRLFSLGYSAAPRPGELDHLASIPPTRLCWSRMANEQRCGKWYHYDHAENARATGQNYPGKARHFCAGK